MAGAELFLTIKADDLTGLLDTIRVLTGPDQIDALARGPAVGAIVRLQEVHELALDCLAHARVEIIDNGECPGDSVDDGPRCLRYPTGGSGGSDRAQADVHGERSELHLDRVPDVLDAGHQGPGRADRQPQPIHDSQSSEVAIADPVRIEAPPLSVDVPGPLTTWERVWQAVTGRGKRDRLTWLE